MMSTRPIWLLLWLTLSYNQLFAACVDTLACLNQIDDNTASQATTLTSHLPNINAQTKDIQQYWRYYLGNYLGMDLSQPTPTLPATPGINTTLFNTLGSYYQKAQTAAIRDTQRLLDGWLNNDLKVDQYMQGTLSNITPNVTPDTGGILAGNNETTTNDTSLNIDVLLVDAIAGLNHEDTDAEDAAKIPAKNFILLLTNVLHTPKIQQSQDGMSHDEWHHYLADHWGLTSKMSLPLSQLFHILRQREVYPGLGTQVGLTDDQGNPQPNASIRQIEAWQINRRLRPEWLESMETAPSIVIQRESLHILAEMLRLKQQIKQQDERILLTLATSVVQGIEIGKALVDLQQQVQKMQQTAAEQASNLPSF